MNVAYSEELSPPKELFSREWFDAWDAADPWEYRTARIDETKKKLEELEVKLRKRIWKSGGYTQDLLVDTVTFLNSYIGVWQVTKFFPPGSNLPSRHIGMVYPRDTSRIMSNWEEVVLGGVQREGVCLSMLSSECVEWLNRLCNWVSE